MLHPLLPIVAMALTYPHCYQLMDQLLVTEWWCSDRSLHVTLNWSTAVLKNLWQVSYTECLCHQATDLVLTKRH